MAHELPPVLKGTEEQQLIAMRDYLVRLAQSLDRVAADNATVLAEVKGRTAKGKSSVRADPATVEELQEQANLLKSLIIKTANEVTQYVDDGFLMTTYASDTGVTGYYQEILRSQVETTAGSVIESYDFGNIVSAVVQDDFDSIQAFMTLIDGEIRRGVIEDPTTHQDVIGIAISQKMSFYSNDDPDPSHQPIIGEDGQTYYRIQENQTFGFYTSTGWQFWINGQKVGWFDSTSSDAALHVASAVIENHVQIGSKWLIDVTDGGEEIGFRYIGG